MGCEKVVLFGAGLIGQMALKKLGENAVDIDGGFILKNGDIEENMSFSALLSSNRDSIEDLINRELFAE